MLVECKKQAETIYLPMSANYVGHWGFWEAIREILQNAIDTRDYRMERVQEQGLLKITSSGGALELASLMLGESSKREDASSIGQYGEGYKLALLVLCRMGKEVVIKNGKDLWCPSLEVHPQLGVECLAIEITEDVYPEEASDEVGFLLSGLSYSDFLVLDTHYITQSDMVEIVAEHNGSQCLNLGEDQGQKVFVGGLYVCDLSSKYRYSYNFAPNVLSLDRDRGSVSDFYLQREATRLFIDSGNIELLIEMATDGCEDITDYYSIEEISSEYGSLYGGSRSYPEQTIKLSLDAFFQKYGPTAYPLDADNPSKADAIRARCAQLGLIPVVVKKVLYNIIQAHFEGKLQVQKLKGSVTDELRGFLKSQKRYMQRAATKKLESLIIAIELAGR